MNILSYRGQIIVRDPDTDNLYWIKQTINCDPYAHVWKLKDGTCEGYIHDSCDPGFSNKDFYKVVDKIINKKLEDKS